MVKHTPLPWKLGHRDTSQFEFETVDIQADDSHFEEHRYWVAMVNTEPMHDKEIGEANAAYIVLAANHHQRLVEALSWTATWLEGALGCEAWVWDGQQRIAAEETLDAARTLLSEIKEASK